MTSRLAAPGPRRARMARLYLGELRQLFDSMDPAPFRERDLDPKAAEYIVDGAREAPAGIAAGAAGAAGPRERRRATAALLRDAVHEYFERRAAGKRARTAAAVSHRPHQPGHRPGLPGSGHRAGAVARPADQPRGLRLAGEREPDHRRLGRAVAADGNLPLRLVADPRRRAAVRPAGGDAGQRCAAPMCRRGRRHERSVAGPCAGRARAAVLCAVDHRRPERQAGEPGGRPARQRGSRPGPA